MAFVAEDRVRDVSSTTGTGSFTVSGTAPTRYRTFNAVLATNDTFAYLIVHQSADQWEVGIGTYSGSHVFARTTVISTSSGEGGSPIDFSAGTKDVVLVYPPVGTTAQYLANAIGKALTTDQVNASGALLALNDSGGAIAWDMSLGFNASITLDGNHTFSNPTNPIVGRTGALVVTQDGTGTRVPAWGTNWEAAAGTLPVLSTGAGEKDIIFYWIQSSTSVIITGILKDVA